MAHRIFRSVGNPPGGGDELGDDTSGPDTRSGAADNLPSPATSTPDPQSAAQIESLNARLVQAEMRTAALDVELIRAQRSIDLGQSAHDALRRELEAAKIQTVDFEKQLRLFEDWVVRLTTQRKRNEAELESLKQRLAESDRALAKTRKSLTGTKAKLSEATNALSEREKELSTVSEELKAERDEHRSLKSRHKQLAAMFSEAKAKISALGAKVTVEKRASAALKKRLSAFTTNLEKSQTKLESLGINLGQLEKSRTWGAVRVVLKAEADLRRSYRRLRKAVGREPSKDLTKAQRILGSEYFDAGWYTKRYLAGGETEIEAALHYLLVGAAQGNDPGPRFSSGYYLGHHTDVAAAGANPLLHYVMYGESEGRKIAPAETPRTDVAEPDLLEPLPARFESPLTAAESPPARFEPPLTALEPVRYPLPNLLAALPDQPPEPLADDALQLQLSGVPLGWLRQQAVQDALQPIAAFTRLSGVDLAEALQHDEQSPHWLNSSPMLSETSPGAGALIALGTDAGCDFVDVWFVNERDLRVRLRATNDLLGAQRLLRCYQYDPSGEKGLALLAEARIPLGELEFVDIATYNAFSPLLFVLGTPGEEILSLTLLPFPSLCRGGAHYGELLAVGAGQAYLEAMRSLSHSLIEERLHAGPSPLPLRIEVDLTGATGAERIFNTDLRQWLSRSLNVELAPEGRPPAVYEAAATYLEQAVRTQPLTERDAKPGGVLRIPADALPSLTVLFAGRLLGRPAQVDGPFVVADAADGAPKWLVSPPAVEPSLATLQPQKRAFPVLASLTSVLDPSSVQAASPPGFPLAIRFCDLSAPDPTRLIMPFALEKSGPLLPDARCVGETRVCVVHHASLTPDHLQAFLESLKFQDGVSGLEIVVYLGEERAEELAAARELLRRHFPDKGSVIPYSGASGYGARLNRAGESARHGLLLLAGGDIILHDPRTITTLAGLAQHDKTASASCMLLGQADTPEKSLVRFQSAGYFPVANPRSDESRTGYLRASVHPARLPPLTWPVAASSSRLLMVRADTWRRLGGFDTSPAQDDGDLEYGLRTARQGYFHFCTSAVSATLLGDGAPADTAHFDAIGPEDFAAATRSGTLLRSLVA